MSGGGLSRCSSGKSVRLEPIRECNELEATDESDDIDSERE